MVVPLNAPKSSILIGCSIINHPAIIHISGGTPRSCISIGLSIINNPANASLIDPPIRLKFHLFQAPKPIHIIHGPMAALGCTRLMFILDEQMYPFISSSIPCILIHIYLSLSIYLSIHSSIHLGGNKNTISNCPLISVSTFLMEKKTIPPFVAIPGSTGQSRSCQRPHSTWGQTSDLTPSIDAISFRIPHSDGVSVKSPFYSIPTLPTL